MDGDWITTREAAGLLRVAQRSVVRYISLGRLDAKRVWEPDGPWLVLREQVAAIEPEVAKARERRHAGLAQSTGAA